MDAAILAVLFCFPLGIVAMLEAEKVDRLFQSGQYAAADQASAQARKWAMWSFGTGFVVVALYLALPGIEWI